MKILLYLVGFLFVGLLFVLVVGVFPVFYCNIEENEDREKRERKVKRKMQMQKRNKKNK